MKHTFPLALALLAAISCSREIAPDSGSSNNTGGDKITISLTATRAVISSDTGSDAKAAVGETGAVSWEAGDKLKLITNDGRAIITDALKEGGESATFTASVSTGDILKWAVYPATAEASIAEGKLQVKIPAVQDGSFKNASISAGEISEEGGASVLLKNICCLLRFTVPNAIDATRKVYFGGNGLPMNGTVALSSASLQNEYVNEEDVSSDKGIRVEVNVNGTGTYYAAVLPNAFSGLTMQTYNADGAVLSENISYALIPAKRSVIKEIGELRTSKFNTKRFVTENGGGAHGGATWEDAWSFTELQSKLRTQALSNVIIFVTGGTITPNANIFTLASDTTFKLFGGYPADLSGEDITSRDFRANETIFVGNYAGQDSKRLFNYQGSTSNTLMDGVTLSNTYQKAADDQYSGTCVLVGVSATAYFVNCTFRDNRKDGNAIIRGGKDGGGVTVKLTLDRCTFKNNTISGKGILNCKPGCTMKIIDCDFTEGNVVSGESDATLAKEGKYRVAYKTGGVIEFSGDNKFAANQVSTK